MDRPKQIYKVHLRQWAAQFEQLKVIIEKGDLYEKYLRFGLVLGRLAVLKKNFGRLSATRERYFHVFRGKKSSIFFLNIVAFALKSCPK